MEKTQITPYTRQEILLDNIAKAIENGGEGSTDISPYTRREILLNNIAKAIENGGGGSGGGLVEIKNVEPFQVPDLVNGGTRLFDPANDSLFICEDGRSYQEIEGIVLISNETPPGIIYESADAMLIAYITTTWIEAEAYERNDTTESPEFCVTPSTFIKFRTVDGTGYIITPGNIVYKYTTSK